MSMDDNDGQMIFGDLGGLKLPDICLTGEEKPRKKTSPRKIVPTGDRTRARCVTSVTSLGVYQRAVYSYCCVVNVSIVKFTELIL